ncbi:MAG: replication restart helicase PriA [Lachnospiraceae bacterium]
MYADIIIDITHEKLDRLFQYSIPSEFEGMLNVGMQVIVPFGRGNKETRGYIVGFSETCGWDADKIKTITRVADQEMEIESRLVALAGWMKEHYGGTMIQALKAVLPIKRKEKSKEKKHIVLKYSDSEGRAKLAEYERKHQVARARLLRALLDDPVLDYELAVKKLGITATVIRALAEQGAVEMRSETVYRDPVIYKDNKEAVTDYTGEQQYAIDQFRTEYNHGERKTYLIHGITGSGKTEVYMEAIAEVIRQGCQAIVLIPEIALTYQTVMRFHRRFGARVSIMNSRMSAGERYDQTIRAKNGEIDIIIGPRSALFTPFQKLGLIVIDEEHESSYKSENTPRYHARETAIARAEMEGASVILGSATPSMEAYFKAQTGEYTLLELKNRTNMQALPEVYTVDMREEMRQGNRSILSDTLKSRMDHCLRSGQQMMLFINRRGYAGFISCRSCGNVVKCPHCDISLTEHRGGRLICHFCGYEQKVLTKCPECESTHIGGFKVGTQQVEDIVKKEFPQARVLRMDKDTTSEKHGHEKILSAFANAEADILIGTQMIVKGHDFEHVTLVGVLAADLSLYANDYRAGERTFQLLAQAAGRAGRGEQKGEVVIQTYDPEHYSIRTAANQDYHAFYAEEINYRSLAGYPPVKQIMAILITSPDETLLAKAADYLAKYAMLRMEREAFSETALFGPAVPYVNKKNDIFRRIIYIKSQNYNTLIVLKDYLEEYIDMNPGFGKTSIQFDFNPMSIF